jgi:hypothetical protein
MMKLKSKRKKEEGKRKIYFAEKIHFAECASSYRICRKPCIKSPILQVVSEVPIEQSCMERRAF